MLTLHLACALAVSTICSTALADAASYSWAPEQGIGNWGDAENWDPDRTTLRNDDEMYVNMYGGAVCNYDQTNQTIGLLLVDLSNTMNHPESKTLQIQTSLWVGFTWATTSTYNLSGATLEVAGLEWIGKTGQG
jgi:hypothetical protein